MVIDNNPSIEEIFSLHVKILHLLRKINQEHWLELDLSMAQLKVLFLLNKGQPMMGNQIAAELRVTAPTVSGLLDRLEQQGLIKREYSSIDRRAIRVSLTAKGLQLVTKLHTHSKEKLIKVYQQMSAEDRVHLYKGLIGFYEAFKKSYHE